MSRSIELEEITLDSIRAIRLYQPRAGYRFSVDSLLLFNFVNLRSISTIADLGAGCGVIGILLAQKYKMSKVTLFEIQERLSELARKNIEINLLQENVEVLKVDIREIPSLYPSFRSLFDVVVSNPPFRKIRSGQINPEEDKALARHEIAIDLAGLIKSADFLLRPKGRLFLIYHPSRLSEIIEELRGRQIAIKRIQFVHSSILTEAKMVLIEGVKGGKIGLKVERPFFIYDESGRYSDAMRAIYEG